MKSIKEKAEEYSEEHGFRVPYDGSNNFYDEVDVKASEEGFVVGANYVLDEIEQLIYEKHVEGNLPLFDLTHLIDKLKEK